MNASILLRLISTNADWIIRSARVKPIIRNLLNAILWIAIVLTAFLLQVMPLLLVLTMVNVAFGVSSEIAFVAIPAIVFGMVFAACWYASVKTRDLLPPPLPVYRMDADDHDRSPASILQKLRHYRTR